MKNQKILCIGAAHVDYTFYPNQPLIKQTSNPISSHMRYGGVIRNVAENLSRLDTHIDLLSLVGSDPLGQQLIHDMNKLMNVEHIDVLDGRRTGQYYAVMNAEGNMDIAYADMSIYDHMDKRWIDEKESLIKSYDIVIADMNIQRDGLETLINIGNNSNITLIIIGVSEPKMKHMPKDLHGVDYLICNMGEANTFFNITAEERDNLQALWQDTGGKHLIITEGNKNIVYINELGAILNISVTPISKSQFINVTGAGDAFSAGLIFGLLNDFSIEKAIGIGIANARLNIGCQDAVKQDLNKEILLKEARIK